VTVVTHFMPVYLITHTVVEHLIAIHNYKKRVINLDVYGQGGAMKQEALPFRVG